MFRNVILFQLHHLQNGVSIETVFELGAHEEFEI